MKNTEMERFGHGAAALGVSSECVEVILCGGLTEGHSRVARTTIVGFGTS